MKNFDISAITAVGGLITALVSGFISFLVWYSNKELRRYGFERDIAHLKKNQEQLQQGIADILDEFEKKFDELYRVIKLNR